MISALELRVREVVWVAPHVIPWQQLCASHLVASISIPKVHLPNRCPGDFATAHLTRRRERIERAESFCP
jgi:hypothetical protein